MIDVDDLSDWVSMAASVQSYMRNIVPPKSIFLIIAEEFFDNWSNDMLDHHSKPPFV